MILTTYFRCYVVGLIAVPHDIAVTLRLAKEIVADGIHRPGFGLFTPTVWTHTILVASKLLLLRLLLPIAIALPVNVKVLRPVSHGLMHGLAILVDSHSTASRRVVVHSIVVRWG